jgi:hypothetical protein
MYPSSCINVIGTKNANFGYIFVCRSRTPYKLSGVLKKKQTYLLRCWRAHSSSQSSLNKEYHVIIQTITIVTVFEIEWRKRKFTENTTLNCSSSKWSVAILNTWAYCRESVQYCISLGKVYINIPQDYTDMLFESTRTAICLIANDTYWDFLSSKFIKPLISTVCPAWRPFIFSAKFLVVNLPNRRMTRRYNCAEWPQAG